MAMQGAFAFHHDLRWRPKRPERLFFALRLDSEISAYVGGLRQRFFREYCLTGTPIELEHLHVSLHPLGDYASLPSNIIYGAQLAANSVLMPPFEATFRSVKSFERLQSFEGRPGRWPLVLLGEGDGLGALHRKLGAAMAKNGLRPGIAFTPHMTLLYGDKPIAKQEIEPIRLLVNDFVLIHSERGLTRHNVIDRWPLRG
jgi:2'-5' RNA ligase